MVGPTAAPTTVLSFRYTRTVTPVLILRTTQSGWPSPLKSATAAVAIAGVGVGVGVAVGRGVAVGVAVGLGVAVAVGRGVAVAVGRGVGDSATTATVPTMLQHPP